MTSPSNGHDAIEAAIDDAQPLGVTVIELWITHYRGDRAELDCRWMGLLSNNPAGISKALRGQADTIDAQFGAKRIEIARDLPPPHWVPPAA